MPAERYSSPDTVHGIFSFHTPHHHHQSPIPHINTTLRIKPESFSVHIPRDRPHHVQAHCRACSLRRRGPPHRHGWASRRSTSASSDGARSSSSDDQIGKSSPGWGAAGPLSPPYALQSALHLNADNSTPTTETLMTEVSDSELGLIGAGCVDRRLRLAVLRASSAAACASGSRAGSGPVGQPPASCRAGPRLYSQRRTPRRRQARLKAVGEMPTVRAASGSERPPRAWMRAEVMITGCRAKVQTEVRRGAMHRTVCPVQVVRCC